MSKFLFLIAIALGLAYPNDNDAKKGVTFISSFKGSYESNLMLIKISIEGKASTLSASIENSNKLSEKIEQALIKGGAKKEEINLAKGKTFPSNYSLFGKIKEYESQTELDVKTKNYNLINTISDILEREKSVAIKNISFSHDNIDSLKKVFISESIKKILDLKSSYEANLGVTMNVCKLSEIGNSEIEKSYREEYGAYRESMRTEFVKRSESFTGFSSNPMLESEILFKVSLCQ